MRTYYHDMRKRAELWVLIAVGGGAGAVARHLVGETLVVNLSGALLLGVFTGVLSSGRLRALLAIGFLGAYTTFSTVAMELVRLVEDERVPVALAYAAVSAAAGVTLAAAGLAAGARLRASR